MSKYVADPVDDIDSPKADDIKVNLGQIPANTSVYVDVYAAGYPEPPNFPYFRRYNILSNNNLNQSEKPVLFWFDNTQKKYRFWYAIEIFNNPKTNILNNESFTMRRRPSPLRLKIANEGQNYTLASARTVWFGFKGRMEHYHWQTISDRWSAYNCYQAVLPHGNNSQIQCPFKNEAAGVQGTCSTGHFGSNPSQNRMPHYCWIDLTGYSFFELRNVSTYWFKGLNEVLVDGRQLY